MYQKVLGFTFIIINFVAGQAHDIAGLHFEELTFPQAIEPAFNEPLGLVKTPLQMEQTLTDGILGKDGVSYESAYHQAIFKTSK